ncbi:DUF7093 family protein [Halegenticoccus tardaugens]|uniref:DUF7093 family protein n=1 Tax=Halegenticoccus tardaugens TaxID=2071624 RepID=UPI00100C32FC|nr:hypothetical protein [Halegenticoccus tardaugens]
MGLRCLLGHEFGEPELEREREEDGNEMVVTVREVKTCVRCGARRVVSENKEVTAAQPTSDDAPNEEPLSDDADARVDAATDAGAAAPADDMPTHPAVRASLADESSSADEAALPSTEDDAVILDDDEGADERSRRPGEWPDADGVDRRDDGLPTLEEVEAEMDEGARDNEDVDGTVDDADAVAGDAGSVDAGSADEGFTPWPDSADEDEGYSAELSDGTPTDVSFGGLAPELARDDEGGPEKGYDAEFIGNDPDPDQRDDGFGDGFTRVDSPSIDEPLASPEVPTEYYCPECGMTRPAGHSSTRAGDICPECRRGYVTEREL